MILEPIQRDTPYCKYAGMVEEPADYRWSSYGEAVGGGRKGNGKKASAGTLWSVRDLRVGTGDLKRPGGGEEFRLDASSPGGRV